MNDHSPASQPASLIAEIRTLIDTTRQRVATQVNTELTLLYWQIGKLIYTEVLAEQRAEYGKQVISTLAQQLTTEYGSSFEQKNLRRMVQFAESYPDQHIVVSLARHLSWTHFIALIPIEDPLKRDFYAEICRLEHWSVRQLRDRVRSMLFERTAISKKPEETIQQDLQMLRIVY